jgi:hypothetical protein
MRGPRLTTVAVAAVLVLAGAGACRDEGADPSRALASGGISVPGWTGTVDANEAEDGFTLNHARLSGSGDTLAVSTGPAVAYWNPANRATGNYRVSARFLEPRYMSANTHPHPYGIMIAGNDLETRERSYLYCAAYGNGRFIVRGFGPDAFRMNGIRGAAHDAVNKAPGEGQPVMQEISLEVRDDVVECSINGTVVASYPKSKLVTDGRLRSTDGVYGIRFAHNTEAVVTGLTLTK